MIIVLTGANDFARVSELKKLTTEFVEKHGDFGLEKIDASNTDFGRIIESVSSLPFLAEKRMIVLSDISANKDLNEKVEDMINSVSDSTELVISEQKFDKRLTLYKTLKKRTEFREFNELSERELPTWLVQESAKKGGELNQNDAQYLVNRAGTNQMSLSNEIEKLISYDPKITKTTIDMLVEPLPSSSMFELLDAAFSGNKKIALELYEDQRKQQVEPQAIMGMIAWQIHVIAVVKFNEKENVGTIASKAKLNPFVVRKTLGLVKSLTANQVKALVSRAAELDAHLKSESIDADDAVQHYLLTI